MLNHVHKLNSFSMLLGLDAPVTKLMATATSCLSSMAGTHIVPCLILSLANTVCMPCAAAIQISQEKRHVNTEPFLHCIYTV